jgi:tetratricopeptide (TPR) repeat protein
VGGSHVDVVFNAGSLQEANEMLGKSYACLGDSDKALTAYRAALAIDGTTDQRTQTALELATLLIDAQEFVPAISVLGLAEDEQLSDAQAFEHLMLNSRLMRRAALPEQAANLLRNKIESIGDPQLRARASVELARCRSEAGDAQEARTLLMGAIPLMDSSPDAWQASCDLAQACFKAGRCDQAITVAKGLLKVACGQEVQSQARSILADAYLSTQPAPLALVAQPFGAVPSVPGDGGQVSNAQPGKAVPPGKGVAQ